MSVEYATWLRIKSRCYDVKDKDFAHWGGRGITVCEAWLHDFSAFLSDMGLRPEDKFSIDRKDGSLCYSPENCRWATDLEQGENKSSNVRVSYEGVDYSSLKEACRALEIPYTTVVERIRAGYSADEALRAGASRMRAKRTKESYLKKSCR